MNNYNNFILSPITKIIEEAVSASAGIGSGIETYPLCDYIMQSVFLKMTGFQEQKMKCICWEMATNDYEYRYKRFSQKPFGECSCYDEKQTIYKDLIEQIEKHIPNFKVSTDIDKQSILITTISEINRIFSNTNLLIWAQNDFNEYRNIINGIEDICFADISNDYLFQNCSNCHKNGKNKQIPKCKNDKNLKEIYATLYKYRNVCAHNTQSYQQNLPTLKTLSDENYQYENYFVRFAILTLIDKIFIELYTKYSNALDSYL